MIKVYSQNEGTRVARRSVGGSQVAKASLNGLRPVVHFAACGFLLWNYARAVRTVALMLAVLFGWSVAGLAQGARPKPKVAIAPGSQSIPPEMVFVAGEGSVAALAFAPDGKTVASAEYGRAIKIYDVASGDLVRMLSEEAPISAVAYAPDGNLLAAGVGRRGEPVNGTPSTTAAVRLWNPQTGQSQGATLAFPGASVRRSLIALAFSPDGKSLAAATGALTRPAHVQVGELTVWDLTTRTVRFHVQAHERQTMAIAFSPDSRLLASGGPDGVVKIWNTTTGELQHTIQAPTAASTIGCLAFFPDSKRLATSGPYGGSDNIWDAESGALVKRNFGGGYARFVLLDGGKTAVFSGTNGLIMMDVETNRPITQLGNVDNSVLAITADGKTLAAGSSDGAIRFWNVEAGKERRHAIGGIPGMDSLSSSLSASPDGSLLALSGAYGVRLWETRQARLRHLLTGPYPTIVNRSVFSADSRLLLSATSITGVRMWETEGGLLLHIFPMSDPLTPESPGYSYVGAAYDIALAPDGSRFAASGNNRIYRIWNLQTFALERTLTTPGDPTRSLAFTPDSLLLATGDMIQEQQTRTNAIRFWDLSTGQVQNVLNDPRDKDRNGRFVPPHIQYVPKKPLLASWAFNDTAVMLWNLPSGQVAKQLSTGPEGLTGLAVSADGSKLAVTTMQGSISLWDLATGKKIRQWRGHDGQALEAAFAPDGKTLYTTGLDRIVKFWSVPDGRLRGTLRFFSAQDGRIANAWIFTTPEGYYSASVGAESLIRWRVNGQLYPAARFQQKYNRADTVEQLLTH